MSTYPPKLVRISEVDFGSILLLDNGTQVSINVRPSRLNQAMIDYALPPLDELITSQSIGVFVGQLQMNGEQWDQIRECVRLSRDATAAFGPVPSLWRTFSEPYPIIAEKYHRLYGGLSRHFLYTSHPFDFCGDPNRPLPWYRALLNASGGWLFNVWVNLGTGVVEIEAEQRSGPYYHFVE